MIRSLREAARALSALIAMLGLAACSPSVPEVFKIGLAAPLSGPTGPRGKDLLDGARLAAEEINAKGFAVDGKPVKIEIVAKDDKADVETTKRVAHELLDEGVHAVIGHVYTPQTQAAVPIYATKGIPNLFNSTSVGLLALGAGNAFRLVANDAVQARALGVFATENLGGRRIVVLMETSDHGKGLFEGVRDALKDPSWLVLKLDLQVGEQLTDAQANQVVAARPDVVVLAAPREAQAASVLTKLDKLGYNGYALIGPNGIKTTNFAKTSVPVKGVYASATTVDFSESAMGRAFAQRFRARYNAEPVWGAHYAYDSVFILADTLKRTRSAKPADLVKGLKTFEANAPVNQQLRFAEGGEQRHPDIGIYKAERGVWVPQIRSSVW